MCGIAGIVSRDRRPVTRSEISAMCAAMVHRGPDDEGIWVGTGVGIGMRRLSIIDLERGHQPIANEDGSIRVVANGEIYNYRELRQQLKARGHVFTTGSDTEVIVHLYEEYGLDFVNHLRGMFGLALWDENAERLVIARDRLGIKPLYYTEQGGRVLFASELKCLLQLPDVARELNWAAMEHLFAFMTTAPTESIIDGVKKLEPAHMLVADRGAAPRLHRYWSVDFAGADDRPESQLVDDLRGLLDECVRMHMVSDVPLGAFLSGGVDSGAVVATMARMSRDPVHTFSIGFNNPGYDESSDARRTAGILGTDHTELILDTDVLDVIGDIAWHLDEPFGDSSAIPTYMVSKLASERVTVVLSGDGGDELFAGYDRYLVEARERRYDRIPRPLGRMAAAVSRAMPEGTRGKNFLYHASLKGMDRYLHAYTLFDEVRRGKLFSPSAAAFLSSQDARGAVQDRILPRDRHWLSRLQYFDLHHYLPLDILTKVDRMSMAHSIEVRVPLLDHKLVEFAASVPPAYHLRGGTTKHLFKQALRGTLPDEVIDRRKRGFAIPLGDWFRGGLGPFVRDLLQSETARRRGLFNHDYIEGLIRLHEQGRPHDLQLWTLISFELWCRTFLDGVAPTLAAEPRYAQQ